MGEAEAGLKIRFIPSKIQKRNIKKFVQYSRTNKPTLLMGLRDKQNAAARATAARLNVRDNVIPATSENGASSDADSDCGYEGGVNCGRQWTDAAERSAEHLCLTPLVPLTVLDWTANPIGLGLSIVCMARPREFH